MYNYRQNNETVFLIRPDTTKDEIQAALKRGDAVAYAGQQKLPTKYSWMRKVPWKTITLRAEQRKNTDHQYWYAYRKIDGRLKKAYIGTRLTPLALAKAWEKLYPNEA